MSKYRTLLDIPQHNFRLSCILCGCLPLLYRREYVKDVIASPESFRDVAILLRYAGLMRDCFAMTTAKNRGTSDMKKFDLKKELKQLYNPPRESPVIVDVPSMNFIMIDGAGDPNKAKEFVDAIQMLYAVSYTLKFMIKKADPSKDYVVMPLEGLWWADDMAAFSAGGNRDSWKWTLMIAQPEQVTKDLFKKACEQVKKKKNLPGLSKIRFENFHEGMSAQIMHIGPYSAEGPTVEKLHAFVKEKGYSLRGKHREIYLSDPRRSSPDKMKTIIRQPMEQHVIPQLQWG